MDPLEEEEKSSYERCVQYPPLRYGNRYLTVLQAWLG
jgi:hypothetical protein